MTWRVQGFVPNVPLSEQHGYQPRYFRCKWQAKQFKKRLLQAGCYPVSLEKV